MPGTYPSDTKPNGNDDYDDNCDDDSTSGDDSDLSESDSDWGCSSCSSIASLSTLEDYPHHHGNVEEPAATSQGV